MGGESLENAEFVTIARVAKTQGRIGEVACDLYTDFPEKFGERKKLYGLPGAGLKAGQWQTLISYQFLHGSWGHVIMNAVAALAFASPVARLFGEGARGSAAIVMFYLTCGVLAGLVTGEPPSQ